MYRIDPHQHSIGCQELLTHLLGELLVVDRRFGLDADSGEFLKDPVKAIVLWCGGVPGSGIAAPQDCDFEGLWLQAASLHASLPALASGAELGRMSDGVPA